MILIRRLEQKQGTAFLVILEATASKIEAIDRTKLRGASTPAGVDKWPALFCTEPAT